MAGPVGSSAPGGANTQYPDVTLTGAGAPVAAPPAQPLQAGGSVSQLLNLQGQGEIPGVRNANGAPFLEVSTLSMSAGDMANYLAFLESKTKDQQLKTAKQGLEVNTQKIQAKGEQALAKIAEWSKKCDEAAAAAAKAKETSWWEKIGTFVAAVAGAVVLGIATGGVGIAIGVAMVVAATFKLADQINSAVTGDKEFGGLSGLIGKGVTKLLAETGAMSEEDAEKWGKDISGAIVVGMAVLGALRGNPAGLIAIAAEPEFMGQTASLFARVDADRRGLSETETEALCEKAAMWTTIATSLVVMVGIGWATMGSGSAGTVSKLSKVGQTIKRAAAITGAVAGVVAGTATVVGGAYKIDAANKTHDGDKALADKKKIDAMIAKMMASMDEDKERLKKVLEEIQAGFQWASDIGTAESKTLHQVASVIGGQKKVV